MTYSIVHWADNYATVGSICIMPTSVTETRMIRIRYASCTHQVRIRYASCMHPVRIRYASGTHPVRSVRTVYGCTYRMRTNLLRIRYAQSSLLMLRVLYPARTRVCLAKA
jgi:hypothetical protein